MRTAVTAPAGHLGLVLTVKPPQGRAGFLSHALPRRGLPRVVNAWRWRNLRRVLVQYAKVQVAVTVSRLCGVATMYGRLSFVLTVDGQAYPLGIAGYRVVTDAGVAFIVDAFQNSKEPENMKYHGFGTGTTNEAASQTALITELTTEYATDNTRPTGTQTENGANTYETVATLDPDADVAITEHGIFDQAANSGGTMLDRTKFSVINVPGTGGTLQATYDFVVTSGG